MESISDNLKELTDLAMTDMPHDTFMCQFRELIEAVRLEERQRACRIVLEYEVYSPYIVEKQFIQTRKDQLVDLIMDGMK